MSSIPTIVRYGITVMLQKGSTKIRVRGSTVISKNIKITRKKNVISHAIFMQEDCRKNISIPITAKLRGAYIRGIER